MMLGPKTPGPHRRGITPVKGIILTRVVSWRSASNRSDRLLLSVTFTGLRMFNRMPSCSKFHTTLNMFSDKEVQVIRHFFRDSQICSNPSASSGNTLCNRQDSPRTIDADCFNPYPLEYVDIDGTQPPRGCVFVESEIIDAIQVDPNIRTPSNDLLHPVARLLQAEITVGLYLEYSLF